MHTMIGVWATENEGECADALRYVIKLFTLYHF